jgi:hypothetical protein
MALKSGAHPKLAGALLVINDGILYAFAGAVYVGRKKKLRAIGVEDGKIWYWSATTRNANYFADQMEKYNKEHGID